MRPLVLGALVVASAAFGGFSGGESGLGLWRKPDATGRSCSGCHSPDGIELAAFGFSRADIVRRASAHLDRADAVAVAKFVLAGHPYRAPLDAADRPLQPGGRLLPGATPEARDDAFGEELAGLVPELAGPPIRTREAALRVRDRILRLDPRTVPVGIPFDRLSEDAFHGPGHGTMADWIPDVPVPSSPELVAAQDAYLAHPDETSLAGLMDAAGKTPPRSMVQQLAIAKYQSLLLLQDAIRRGGPAAARLADVRRVGDRNPFWAVAEVGRLGAVGSAVQLSLPPDVLAKKRTVPLADQMRRLRLPWYWAGWTLDPSLTHTPGRRDVERADYLTQYLWTDGPYPFHAVYMLTTKLIDEGFGKDVRLLDVARHYELQFSYFTMHGRLLRGEPSDPAARVRFRTICANAFRLALLLLEADLKSTGACLRPESQTVQIRAIRDYFVHIALPEADLDLCDRVERELLAARVEAR